MPGLWEVFGFAGRVVLVAFPPAVPWHTSGLEMALATWFRRGSVDRDGSPGALQARLARLGRPTWRRVAGYGIAVLGTAAVTLAFLPVREETTSLSKGFVFLAVVVTSAAIGGLGPGILSSLLGFLAFNFFHSPRTTRSSWHMARTSSCSSCSSGSRS